MAVWRCSAVSVKIAWVAGGFLVVFLPSVCSRHPQAGADEKAREVNGETNPHSFPHRFSFMKNASKERPATQARVKANRGAFNTPCIR